MPNMRLIVTGERVRNFLTLQLKEIDREVERGQKALVAIKADMERFSANAQQMLQDAAARQMGQPMGLSALGGFVHGSGVPDIGHLRAQVGRIENTIATLGARRAQTTWLQESFDPTVKYELDSSDLTMLGMVPVGNALQGAFNSVLAGSGDPFGVGCC